MRVLIALSALTLAACASVPPSTPDGANVRQLTADQAKSCTFIKPVAYVDHIFALGKNPTLWRSIGEAEMRNRAAAAGGNAVVITSDDASWFGGDFNYRGEAYRCA